MSEWQSIDTAPKDGTVILAYDPKWNPPLPALFYKDENEWRIFGTNRRQYGEYAPTHRMPLPEPPK